MKFLFFLLLISNTNIVFCITPTTIQDGIIYALTYLFSQDTNENTTDECSCCLNEITETDSLVLISIKAKEKEKTCTYLNKTSPILKNFKSTDLPASDIICLNCFLKRKKNGYTSFDSLTAKVTVDINAELMLLIDNYNLYGKNHKEIETDEKTEHMNLEKALKKSYSLATSALTANKELKDSHPATNSKIHENIKKSCFTTLREITKNHKANEHYIKNGFFTSNDKGINIYIENYGGIDRVYLIKTTDNIYKLINIQDDNYQIFDMTEDKNSSEKYIADLVTERKSFLKTKSYDEKKAHKMYLDIAHLKKLSENP